MCDLAAPAVLDRYASTFRARVERFQGQLALVRASRHQVSSGALGGRATKARFVPRVES